jgi:aminopeptidase-like protein
MNLEMIYTCMDDAVPEQKHIDLVFLFSEKNHVADYTVHFETGMPLEEFRKYMYAIGDAMKHTAPTECRGNA